MLQPRMFQTVLQHFYPETQGARRRLLFGVSHALRHGHRSGLHQSKAAFQNARERTLIAVKPDGVQRRLVGQIIQRFEQRGFKLVGLKMVQASHDILSEHYGDLRTKPFFHSLLTYMSSGPVVVMVWEGHDVVQGSRKMVGQTNPAEAPPGTIRGDFSVHVSRNVVHASDSQEGAQKEIQLWFQAKDLLDWDCCDQTYTTEV
ncbi:nucleoside diphosphate kinase, mitochondrial [Oryzias melastigma]|uniref:nucleoside diphosphate kinase, mitochondrial n=1 Tax=Oryzias melastigma TaxID=30732 RepID=UPI000CF7D09A|nr:nucleoside diphosphate kinase, mitochondrial [Oryzias melastigma]